MFESSRFLHYSFHMGLVGWYAWYLGLKSGNSKVRCSNPGVTECFLNFLLTFTQRKAQICALGLNLILGYFVYICQVTTVRERERKREREIIATESRVCTHYKLLCANFRGLA